jgi:predicted small lipoprotein YifL
MSRFRFVFRLALVGAMAAALGLGACGRKGPLDPPPGASLEGEPQPHMPELMSNQGQPKPGTPVQPSKKTSPLDVLLN